MINGMGSIDNAYLLVALMWGLYALAIFVAMCIWPPIRLAISVFRFAGRSQGLGGIHLDRHFRSKHI